MRHIYGFSLIAVYLIFAFKAQVAMNIEIQTKLVTLVGCFVALLAAHLFRTFTAPFLLCARMYPLSQRMCANAMHKKFKYTRYLYIQMDLQRNASIKLVMQHKFMDSISIKLHTLAYKVLLLLQHYKFTVCFNS